MEEDKKLLEEMKENCLKGKNYDDKARYLKAQAIENILNELDRLQKENKELHKEIDRMKSLDIYKLVEDWETGQLIPRQKIKDKIEYLDKQQNQWLEDRELKASDSEIIFARNFLQELLKESEKKMNEEEKKAVEFIRDLITWDVRQYLCPNKEECKNLEIILNLIEKLQKQIEELNIRLQEEINEKCKLKTELYLNSIPKTVIQDKIEEIINNPTYGYVGCEWNDIEVVQLLENILEGEEKNVNYKNSNNSIMDISRNNYIN